MSVVTDIDGRSATVRAESMPKLDSKGKHRCEGKMSELLTLVAALAIALIGIAIMLQIISVEEVFALVFRAAMVIMLAFVLLCLLRGLWLGAVLPWLFAAFEVLKTLVEGFFLVIVGFIAILLIGRLVLRRFRRYLTLRRDPQTGDGYGINDSQNKKN